MENNEKGIINKFRKYNRKAIMSGMTIVLVAILIIVSTLFQAGIDPSYWGSSKFIANLLITLAICVVGITSGNAEGDNYFRTKIDGLYINCYNKFNETIKKIQPIIDKFTHWSENLYKKELHKKELQYLRINFGIKQAEDILKLDRTQILELEQPCKFNEVYFKSLNKEQIKAAIYVIDGNIKLKYINEDYWLNAYAKNKNKGEYEQIGNADKEQRRVFSRLTLYRLSTTIIVGLIFSGLAVNQNEDISQAQVWITMFSRLWTLANSVMWGIYTASDLIKNECVFLNYKTRMLDTFYLEVFVNKTFNAKTQSELAKEAYEKSILESEKENENGTKQE